ncbi:alpha/beta fold hydrolase [Streptomyces sp. NBC_01485]|uniref:thioesterase II family protein n=1 Tax=Streptomyces sp. NBC_01485 TaxID=2903884 RepID=UPI002E377747|nr:alpha/beta fold hydrolase [Streptomyces sp. NBC_01485]
MDPRTRPARWLVRRRERPEAPLNVYVFAHAGGSSAEYLLWTDELTEVQLWGVQLPGRSVRRAEPAHTAIGPLVADLVSQSAFTGPYVLFGHSFGGLLAYETTRALRREGRDLPEHLVLSSSPAPHTFGTGGPAGSLHTLSDEELITAAEARWGPLPEQVHADARLRRLVLGPLRADISVFETYVHEPEPPLEVPATLLCGTGEQDRLAGESAGWARHLDRITRRVALPGGHFYFREDHAPLLDVIREVAGEVGVGRSRATA